MKALLSVILALIIAVAGQAQILGQASTDKVPGVSVISEAAAIQGQLAPIIYTGTITCAGNVQDTTRWLQIGWSPSTASQALNNRIILFNPDYATLTVSLSTTGDSVDFNKGWFEVAYDTTALAGWNADSSNFFVSDGNYNRSDYGVWTFENIVGLETTYDDNSFVYPLRVLRGAFIRFFFFNKVSGNDVVYTWMLTAER